MPLDDKATYKLFQNGQTEAVFQFESGGMQAHAAPQALPTRFEDLIALNAMYRPGPMENIPSFVARKHGREDVAYPHPSSKAFWAKPTASWSTRNRSCWQPRSSGDIRWAAPICCAALGEGAAGQLVAAVDVHPSGGGIGLHYGGDRRAAPGTALNLQHRQPMRTELVRLRSCSSASS